MLIKSLVMTLGILSLTACGCGGSGGNPNLVKVSGKVSINGTAISQGMISFTSAKGDGYSSPIGNGGQYSLGNTETEIGALPGEYKVMVVANDGIAKMGENGKVELPKSLVPEKYSNLKSTDLTASVKAGQSNEINFDLK